MRPQQPPTGHRRHAQDRNLNGLFDFGSVPEPGTRAFEQDGQQHTDTRTGDRRHDDP
jgi:hypothetical protein